MVAFALAAIIGDIHRFADPKKLVKYIGLNPAFDDSGQAKWSGGIAGHGRKDLRCLLIESAHAILRSKHPSGQVGPKTLAPQRRRQPGRQAPWPASWPSPFGI
jgi:transposase